MRYHRNQSIAAWQLADAATQSPAAMQCDECACRLLQFSFSGKFLQGRLACNTESQGAPGDLQQQLLLALSE